ncbi:MAG: hypothetical protein M3323_09350 [Actinomycetota bacterium]|nr:hypothetical protein [Actinomycetota bacterium]
MAGGAGADVLRGGPGVDVLAGQGGTDRLAGDKDADALQGGPGTDFLHGGPGSDTLTFAAPKSGVTVDLARGRAEGDAVTDVENATGTRYRDHLSGDAARNLLLGGDGSDRLYGAAGNDVILGSGGDDELGGGPGRDVVSFAVGRAVVVDLARGRASGQGKDRLSGFEVVQGSPRADHLLGDAGSNTLLPGGGSDNFLDGRTGFDLVSYRGEQSELEFDLPRDVVRVDDSFEDTIERIEGAVGGARDNLFIGDAGDNVFRGGGSSNTYVDSRGNDLFRGSPNSSDHLDLSDTPVAAEVDLERGIAGGLGRHRLVGVERVTGSPQGDTIAGGGGSNYIVAGAGSDVVYGRGGADVLYGYEGNDVLRGGGNDDELWGSDGADRLEGGGGLDFLHDEGGDDEVSGGPGTDLAFVGAGSDRISGGPGTDVVHPGDRFGPFEVDLAAGAAQGYGTDSLVDVEGAVGTEGDDLLAGDAGRNLLYGGRGGNDVLSGGPGDDLLQTLWGDDDLSGGDGDDYLMATEGIDRADGGAGSDECWYADQRVACEGDETNHAPQFEPRFSESVPDGWRSPRAISLYDVRGIWMGGNVVDLFGRGCFNGRISIDRLIRGRWERVATVDLWSSDDDTYAVSFVDLSPPKTAGRYRARVASVPDRGLSTGTSNCMAAVSEPFSWRPPKSS